MGRKGVPCVNPLNLESHNKKSSNNVSKQLLEACRIRKIEVKCEENDRICIGCYRLLTDSVRKTKVDDGAAERLEEHVVALEETGCEPLPGPSGIKGGHKLLFL